MVGVSANRLEALGLAEALAREKGIDPELVMKALGEAIEKAAQLRYGSETLLRTQIDRKTGHIALFRVLRVVETPESETQEISLAAAQNKDPSAAVGGELLEPLPPVDFGRVAAQTARQVILQKVREAERERQYEDYKNRVGEVVNGIVKRVEYGNVVLDLGQAEAVARREEILPREVFHPGERLRAYIYEVRPETRGAQIFLSRVRPEFMEHLFAQEVPEIYDGIIEIRAVARDPGSRAKIAVISNDSTIDPVGACVGLRGSRVQAVVNELQGEKIDIIPWSADPATFIVNALAPAEVGKVILDEEARRIEVVVPQDQLSLAIGRRGQNVRLASQITGWDIDILTEEEESERRQREFAERSALFMQTLEVDEVVAQLLASEGFASLEEIAAAEPAELSALESFDEARAQNLQKKASHILEEQRQAHFAKSQALGIQEDLMNLAAAQGIKPEILVALGEKGIQTVENLADLASDDLVGWDDDDHHEGFLENFGVSRRAAEEWILAARRALGWIDEEEDTQEPS